MSNDYKSGVRKAMESYHTKLAKKEAGPTRKNEKPEQEVRKQVLPHIRAKGWFVFVADSTAIYSQNAGRFLGSQIQVGCADVLGLTDSGQFLALELKAPGRLSSLRPAQLEFLVNVISRGGLGLVADSVARLEMILQTYKSDPRPETLMGFLPKKKVELGELFITEDL